MTRPIDLAPAPAARGLERQLPHGAKPLGGGLGAAVIAMRALANAAMTDPLRGSDRGEALAQVWAEYGQTGRAEVGGELRTLAAQYGQTVAGRLSASSPVQTGRIDHALDEFARVLQAHMGRPHRSAGAVVEPLLRSVEAGLHGRTSPQGRAGGDVDDFVAVVEGATEILRRAPPR